MMSLVKRVAFTKWAPQGIFGAKSIFRHGGSYSMSCRMLFVDGWFSNKNRWTSIFGDIGQSLFLDCQAKNRYVKYYLLLIIFGL